MCHIKELKAYRISDSFDARNAFEELCENIRIERENFAGSMKFKSRGNAEYLIFRPKGSSTQRSLGRRNTETESILQKFNCGKADVKDRISELRSRLSSIAPVISAHGLGRVPDMTSRVLRKFDDLGWLGESAIVAGSNSLYAYEIQAGVQIQGNVNSKEAPDVLKDTFRKLSFIGHVNKRSFIGILQSLDKSFKRLPVSTVSAANRDGFKVEIHEPMEIGHILACESAQELSQPGEAVNSPSSNGSEPLRIQKLETTVFDRKGRALKISTLDPRIFALLKKWNSIHSKLCGKTERLRDAIQAEIAANIAVTYLGLKFDEKNLPGISQDVRCLANEFDFERGSRD